MSRPFEDYSTEQIREDIQWDADVAKQYAGDADAVAAALFSNECRVEELARRGELG